MGPGSLCQPVPAQDYPIPSPGIAQPPRCSYVLIWLPTRVSPLTPLLIAPVTGITLITSIPFFLLSSALAGQCQQRQHFQWDGLYPSHNFPSPSQYLSHSVHTPLPLTTSKPAPQDTVSGPELLLSLHISVLPCSEMLRLRSEDGRPQHGPKSALWSTKTSAKVPFSFGARSRLAQREHAMLCRLETNPPSHKHPMQNIRRQPCISAGKRLRDQFLCSSEVLLYCTKSKTKSAVKKNPLTATVAAPSSGAERAEWGGNLDRAIRAKAYGQTQLK